MTDAYRPEDDPILRRLRDSEERRLRQNYIDPLAPDPDEAGNARRLSEESGLPESYVRVDPAAGERAAQAQRSSRALAQAPRLRAWMADERNAAVARDDVEALSVFERAAEHLRPRRSEAFPGENFARDTFALAALPLFPYYAAANAGRMLNPGDPLANEQGRQGELDVEHSQLAHRAYRAQRGLGEPLTTEEQARLDELATRPGQEDWGPFIIGPTRRLWPQIAGAVGRGASEGARGYREASRQVTPTAADYEHAAQRDDRVTGALEAGVYDLSATVGAPTVGAFGAFGRGVGGYLSFGNEMEIGQFYDQAVRSGADPDIAARRAEEYGNIATAIEFASDVLFLPLSGSVRLLSRMVMREAALGRPGVSVAGRAAGAVGRGSAEQGAEEAMQQLAQVIHEDLARQETQSGQSDVGQAWRNALTPENIEQILMAGYIGAQGGAGMASVPASANLALDIRAAQRAEQAATQWEEMTRAAQASRLGQRLPSALESAVNAVDDSSVYIDADRFLEHFQTVGADPFAAAEELGVSADALAQAVSSHGQVQVRTGTFAARLLRVPQHAGLAEHARVAPDAYTPAEARMAGERMQADIERLAQETDALQSDAEIGQMVEQRMRELFAQAEQEGGPIAAVNARYARLVAALPRAMLARARQVNPEYATRLEGQLRTLFGEKLDFAGPGRAEGVATAEMGQGGKRGVGSERGEINLQDPRLDELAEGAKPLSPDERYAVAAALANFNNEEIATHLQSKSRNSVMVLLSKAKKKLGRALWEAGDVGGARKVDPARVLAVRDQLRAQGVPEHRIGRRLSERFPQVTREHIYRLLTNAKQQGELNQGPSDGQAQDQDPVNDPGFRERLDRVQESLGRDEPGSEAGGAGSQDSGAAGQGAREGGSDQSQAPVRDGDARDPALGKDARLALSVSGLRLEAVDSINLGSVRAGIDLPFDLNDARLQDALEVVTEDRTHNAVVRFYLIENGKDVGDPDLKHDFPRDGVYIAYTAVPDALNRTGVGTWLYRQVIDWAHRRGHSVYSDGTVSAAAWEMYTRRLPELGYEVERIDYQVAFDGKTYESDDMRPIWAIHPSTAEEYEAAPPPRGDYQIDAGPSLRERVAGRRGPDELAQPVDDPVNAAQSQGYQGQDTGEAVEWLNAIAKGLPMDEASRMARAREMGFDVDTPLYRGMAGEIEGQQFRATDSGWPLEPPGVSLDRSPRIASAYATGRAETDALRAAQRGDQIEVAPAVYPAYARGRLVPQDVFESRARQIGVDQAQAEFREQGFVGTAAPASRDLGGQTGEIRIWPDEDGQVRNIRSRFAAFDPANEGSAGLLGHGRGDADGLRGAMRAYFEGEFPEGFFPSLKPFRPGEFGDARIRLTEKWSLSTFLHEFGHLGHFILESIARDPEAPVEFKQMWQSTLDWWGVTQEEWASLGREGREPHLERWARTFEAYLMEGKAPSLSLREAFAAFKAWLTQFVYKFIRLDHNLTPEIRDVFDRLLATDAEIAEARAAQGADFKLAREAFNSEEEFAQYQAAIQAALEAQEAEFRARAMDAYTRKGKRWWRSQREQERPAAEREVDSDPARRAFDWLAFQDWKPLPDTQLSDEGEIGYTPAANAMEEMPEGLPAMRLDARALDAEDIAGLPRELLPLTDVDAALENAMALKREGKGKLPTRLWSFIKAQGGINDTGGEIRQALGSGRVRPGLINNATGLDPDELALRAWEAGYFGAVPRKGEVELFSMAGQRARTADRAALRAALEGIARGDDPEIVRRKTGWYLGPDGKWRFEIDDSGARVLEEGVERLRAMRLSAKPTLRLPDVFNHEALYEAYPALRQVRVRRAAQGESSSMGRDMTLAVVGRSLDDIRGSILHEATHWIQRREGHRRGIAPEAFLNDVEKHGFGFALDMNPAVRAEFEATEGSGWHERFRAAYALYMRATGEVEARDVSERASLSAEERAETPPRITTEFSFEPQRHGLGEAILATLKEMPLSWWLRMGSVPAAATAIAKAMGAFEPRKDGVGRASDGSILPVRSPEPFRNSLRGGSEDLAEAAGMERARESLTEEERAAWERGELFQNDIPPYGPSDYGANDRGIINRIMAMILEAPEPEPGGTFPKSSMGGVFRTGFMRFPAVANFNLDPEIAAAFQALSPRGQDEVIRRLEAALDEYQREGKGYDVEDAWRQVLDETNDFQEEPGIPVEAMTPDERKYEALLHRQRFQVIEGYKDKLTELYQEGELFAGSDRRPTARELIDALIDDLKNVRQVYSVRDADAVARYQERADAIRWFESRGVDLNGTKDEIRAQLEAALAQETEQENAVDPDTIADWFGFDSGDHLIQSLKGLKPRAVAIEEAMERRMEAAHGDPMRDGTMAEAARLAAHVEAQAHRIELELAAIQQATGMRKTPVGKAARAFAEAQVNAMSVKEVRAHERFLAGERRAARNAMEALEKGDHQTALIMKQRQLASFWLYRLARDAAEEMDKFQRYARKFDRDTIRAKIHAPLMDQIDQALEGIDLRVSPPISNRRRQTFLAWFGEMQAEGLEHMVAVDPEFLEAVRQRPFASLTVEEARGMRDAVKNFEHIGRRWREVLAARDQRLLDEAVADMAAIMADLKPLAIQNLDNYSPDTVEQIDDTRQHGHAINSRQTFVFYAMDGHRYGGPMHRRLMQPIRDARGREEMRLEAAQEAIGNLLSVYSAKERADMWTRRRYYPQVWNKRSGRMGMNLTKQEVLAVALNTGNDYNTNALLQGAEWSADQVRALLDATMDARDWAFVQSVWDYIDSFWPEIEALYRDIAGVVPPKVEARPFVNQHGEWRGGYYPLKYDWGKDQRAQEEREYEMVQRAFGGLHLRTQTPNGFTRARQGSGGRPVMLDLSVFTEHVNAVIHDLEFRVPVLDAWRVIKHPAFRDAFVRVAGQRQYDRLKPWLQFIATERLPPENIITGVIRLLRQNTPIALMGYAASTVAQQPAGILGTMHKLGVARVTARVAETFAQPWTWLDRARFVNARSIFMRNRTRFSQREIREMRASINERAHIDAVNLLLTGNARQKLQGLAQIKRVMGVNAFYPMAFVDKWVSSIPWMIAYEDAMAGRVENVPGGNEKEAVDYADHIIDTTFGSGRPEDMPEIMRSTELGKLLTPAFSYFATQYNQLWNDGVPGMLRGRISPIEVMTFIFLALFVQQLVSDWARGAWEPDDDESEEDRNRRLASGLTSIPFAGMPIIRDVARGVSDMAWTGRRPRGDTVPALGAITSTTAGVGGTIQAIGEGREIDRTTARALVMSGGYWFGYPSRQMWTTGSFVSDVATGEEDAPWDSDEPLDAWSEALLRDTR